MKLRHIMLVVFFSILVMVLIANLVVQRIRHLPVHVVYGGLLAALLALVRLAAGPTTLSLLRAREADRRAQAFMAARRDCRERLAYARAWARWIAQARVDAKARRQVLRDMGVYPRISDAVTSAAKTKATEGVGA